MGKRCGNCANGTWLKGMDAVPEVCLECKYVHAEPSNWKEKVPTNADRIRAMSDEALEDFIRKISICFEPWCDKHCKFDIGDNCNTCLRDWLKQPAEVDND